MVRLGFPNESTPQRVVSLSDSLKKRFYYRLELLHTRISKQYRHDVFCYDYRGNITCCGVFLSIERAFVCKGFTWPESFCIRLRDSKRTPPKDFYLMVLKYTERVAPLTDAERKSVNKLVRIKSK